MRLTRVSSGDGEVVIVIVGGEVAGDGVVGVDGGGGCICRCLRVNLLRRRRRNSAICWFRRLHGVVVGVVGVGGETCGGWGLVVV